MRRNETVQRARSSWPARDDAEAWATLANQAMQLEMLEVDQAENDAWMKAMHALVAEQLDYDTFTARRMAALSDRLRSRKLAQTNLRYKYGLKQRRGSLVRLDVKRYLLAHA